MKLKKSPTCARCKGPRPGGSGRRYCAPCSILRAYETQDEAMERFRDRHPGYWREVMAERRAR